jgi:hypothetical protein
MTMVPEGGEILVSEGSTMPGIQLPMTIVISGIEIVLETTLVFDPPVQFQNPTVIAGSVHIRTRPLSWWRRALSWCRRGRI